MMYYVIGADQKMPKGLVKTPFLGDVETALGLSIKPWFGELAKREIPFWTCGFLFNKYKR